MSLICCLFVAYLLLICCLVAYLLLICCLLVAYLLLTCCLCVAYLLLNFAYLLLIRCLFRLRCVNLRFHNCSCKAIFKFRAEGAFKESLFMVGDVQTKNKN